jgi:hypothetical protein
MKHLNEWTRDIGTSICGDESSRVQILRIYDDTNDSFFFFWKKPDVARTTDSFGLIHHKALGVLLYHVEHYFQTTILSSVIISNNYTFWAYLLRLKNIEHSPMVTRIKNKDIYQKI